jgi:glycosyltransferase involved in cell wall biosynthesis
MKILMVHNSYQQPGGEDSVFDAERELLSTRGHRVCVYKRHNDEIKKYGLLKKSTLPLRTFWAWDSATEIRRLIESEQPDVVHFHNTFPLISPAAYYACKDAGIPVIQSLHNPRLICPVATLHRSGHACLDCLNKPFAWPGVLRGCYRDSQIQTGIVAGMLAVHRHLKTWNEMVDTYIVFTNFYRQLFVQAGLPPAKIKIKPHFITPDPGSTSAAQEYALFVGRLAPEKGVPTLLKAWRQLSSIPLKIRGEGPLETEVRRLQLAPNVVLIPRLSRKDLTTLFHGARFLVWPSDGYYETFGLAAAQAFACGIPVIASRIGVMKEMVRDGVTGLLFNPGDPDDLAAKVLWAWENRKQMAELGAAARIEYERKYQADNNYETLLEIYSRACDCKPRKASQLWSALEQDSM